MNTIYQSLDVQNFFHEGTAPKDDKESSCYSLFLVRSDADTSA